MFHCTKVIQSSLMHSASQEGLGLNHGEGGTEPGCSRPVLGEQPRRAGLQVLGGSEGSFP